MIHEEPLLRQDVVEVAKQAGHSPTMTLATYGHVIEELDAAKSAPLNS